MAETSQIINSRDILDRARKIKLILMDVDGTLTDGSINLTSKLDAEREEANFVSET